MILCSYDFLSHCPYSHHMLDTWLQSIYLMTPTCLSSFFLKIRNTHFISPSNYICILILAYIIFMKHMHFMRWKWKQAFYALSSSQITCVIKLTRTTFFASVICFPWKVLKASSSVPCCMCTCWQVANWTYVLWYR